MFKTVKWLLITLAVAVLLVITLFSISELSKPFDSDVVQITARINKQVALVSLAQRMEYYDEVLTQSARNYVFTGEVKWKDRYLLFEHRLDSVVREAIRISAKDDIRSFTQLDTANKVLVDMEHNAIARMDAGEKTGALEILESSEYSQYKKLYMASIGNYLTGTLKAYEDVIQTSDNALNNVGTNTKSKLEINLWIVIAGLAIIIGLITVASIGFSRQIQMISKGLNVLMTESVPPQASSQVETEFGKQLETIQQKIILQRESAVQSALSNHRTILKRNLHDSMGVVLSTLKLQLFTLNPNLSNCRGESALRKDYDQCIYLVNKAYNEMRALSQPEVGNAGIDLSWLLNSLVSQTETVYPCKIIFDNNFPKLREHQLSEEMKRDIYLLCSEAINNIIKHSGARNVVVRISEKLDCILLTIRDDGQGFHCDPVQNHRGNGLRNIRDRVAAWNGQVLINSGINQGTIVKIELPASAEHYILK